MNKLIKELMRTINCSEEFANWQLKNTIRNYDLRVGDTTLEYEQFLYHELSLDVKPELIDALVDYLEEMT